MLLVSFIFNVRSRISFILHRSSSTIICPREKQGKTRWHFLTRTGNWRLRGAQQPGRDTAVRSRRDTARTDCLGHRETQPPRPSVPPSLRALASVPRRYLTGPRCSTRSPWQAAGPARPGGWRRGEALSAALSAETRRLRPPPPPGCTGPKWRLPSETATGRPRARASSTRPFLLAPRPGSSRDSSGVPPGSAADVRELWERRGIRMCRWSWWELNTDFYGGELAMDDYSLLYTAWGSPCQWAGQIAPQAIPWLQDRKRNFLLVCSSETCCNSVTQVARKLKKPVRKIIIIIINWALASMRTVKKCEIIILITVIPCMSSARASKSLKIGIQNVRWLPTHPEWTGNPGCPFCPSHTCWEPPSFIRCLQ